MEFDRFICFLFTCISFSLLATIFNKHELSTARHKLGSLPAPYDRPYCKC